MTTQEGVVDEVRVAVHQAAVEDDRIEYGRLLDACDERNRLLLDEHGPRLTPARALGFTTLALGVGSFAAWAYYDATGASMEVAGMIFLTLFASLIVAVAWAGTGYDWSLDLTLDVAVAYPARYVVTRELAPDGTAYAKITRHAPDPEAPWCEVRHEITQLALRDATEDDVFATITYLCEERTAANLARWRSILELREIDHKNPRPAMLDRARYQLRSS